MPPVRPAAVLATTVTKRSVGAVSASRMAPPSMAATLPANRQLRTTSVPTLLSRKPLRPPPPALTPVPLATLLSTDVCSTSAGPVSRYEMPPPVAAMLSAIRHAVIVGWHHSYQCTPPPSIAVLANKRQWSKVGEAALKIAAP